MKKYVTKNRDQLLKEQIAFLKFTISDIENTISRADTKVSILLATIGVFLSTTVTILKSASHCCICVIMLSWVAIVFSVATIVLGLFVLLNRNPKNNNLPNITTRTQIKKRLAEQLSDLHKVCNTKYTFFKWSLVSFAFATIATIALVVLRFLIHIPCIY